MAPLWIADLLPFVDLPQHLALTTILRDYLQGDPAVLAQYTVRWFPVPYLLFHVPCALLGLVMPVEVAAKLFLSATVVLWPLSFYAFVRSVGGNRWYALAAFPLGYGYNMMWGFVSFMSTLPVLFFALAVLTSGMTRHMDNRRRLTWSVAIALLLLLAFFGHAQVYLTLVLFSLVLLAADSVRTRRVRWEGLVAIVPSMLVFIYWLRVEPVGGVTSNIGLWLIKGVTPATLLCKLACFPEYVLSGNPLDEVVVLALLAAMVVARALRPRKTAAGADARGSWAAALLGTAAATYLLLPWRLAAQLYVFHRYALLVVALGIALLSRGPRLPLARRIIASVVIVVSIGWVAVLTGRFLAFNKTARPAKQLVREVPPQRRLVGLIFEETPPSLEFPSFLHFATYYQVWSKGEVASSFTRSVRGFVLRLKDRSLFHRPNVWAIWSEIYPVGWREYDYFLTCGSPKTDAMPLLDSLQLVDREGIWALYVPRTEDAAGNPGRVTGSEARE